MIYHYQSIKYLAKKWKTTNLLLVHFHSQYRPWQILMDTPCTSCCHIYLTTYRSCWMELPRRDECKLLIGSFYLRSIYTVTNFELKMLLFLSLPHIIILQLKTFKAFKLLNFLSFKFFQNIRSIQFTKLTLIQNSVIRKILH